MSDDLIKRLENAQGPDRETDCLIVKAVYGVNPYAVASELKIGDWKFYTDDMPVSDVPCYTASIDAAVALLPPGLLISITIGHGQAAVTVKTGSIMDPKTKEWSGRGTPPNAVAAAALRARAAIAATNNVDGGKAGTEQSQAKVANLPST